MIVRLNNALETLRSRDCTKVTLSTISYLCVVIDDLWMITTPAVPSNAQASGDSIATNVAVAIHKTLRRRTWREMSLEPPPPTDTIIRNVSGEKHHPDVAILEKSVTYSRHGSLQEREVAGSPPQDSREAAVW